MKVVSICPSNTDLMEHLGLLDLVVARDIWSDWPEGKVEDIPSLGTVLSIKVDDIKKFDPDLVLASNNVPGMEKVVANLMQTDLPYVVYDPESWQDVLENIQDLGKRTKNEKKANEVINWAQAQVEEIKNEAKDLEPISMTVEWWHEPSIVPGSDTYVNEVLSWVNVENPFKVYKGRSGRLPDSVVADADTDLYAISWCGTKWDDYDTKKTAAKYSAFDMKISKEPERIFKLWEGIIGHPSLRLIDGARTILNKRKELGI